MSSMTQPLSATPGSKLWAVFQVNNPATGDLLTEVPFMGKEDTELAIDAAYNAFPGL